MISAKEANTLTTKAIKANKEKESVEVKKVLESIEEAVKTRASLGFYHYQLSFKASEVSSTVEQVVIDTLKKAGYLVYPCTMTPGITTYAVEWNTPSTSTKKSITEKAE